ncbi:MULTISPECIES: hypothetical protein [Streptomyces]|uniref:Uncharacterized protein n=2 Tax=Streptomyces poriferorum TaxID=2798799 RepID=A0ABY9ISL2_9ACTN|nr:MULTISPECIES: hypothetical protein [unclassified Streptomyces]MDP5314412.1 hypothetical protein [Streptomyces sp. Alt4]WLQ56671.1 hypothetical protein P8A19_14995 [Streptomyces sp. Alt2]WSI65464.1 hypothetical protein OG471_27020 [Streptomyces sp. NBC_01336]
MPEDEAELRRMVRGASLGDDERDRVRERLWRLRRDRGGDGAPEGGEVLLPEVVLTVPTPWLWEGWTLPSSDRYVDEDAESIAHVRAVLEACLPDEPVPREVRAVWDAPDWDADTGIRRIGVPDVLRRLMPETRLVTRERMAAARAEAEVLAIPGVPGEVEPFIAFWLPYVREQFADAALRWIAQVDEEDRLVPWAMELALCCVERRCAAEQAVWMLRWTVDVPESLAALRRIATDPAAGADVRGLAEDGLPGS